MSSASAPSTDTSSTIDVENGSDSIELNVIAKPQYELDDEQERMLDVHNLTLTV